MLLNVAWDVLSEKPSRADLQQEPQAHRSSRAGVDVSEIVCAGNMRSVEASSVDKWWKVRVAVCSISTRLGLQPKTNRFDLPAFIGRYICDGSRHTKTTIVIYPCSCLLALRQIVSQRRSGGARAYDRAICMSQMR